MAESIAYNMDCMEYMLSLPDKAFDLAVVDPPYGISITSSGRLKKYNANKKKWDEEIPQKEYFEELFRVSNNQLYGEVIIFIFRPLGAF